MSEKKEFTNDQVITVKAISRGLLPLNKKYAKIRLKQTELELELESILNAIESIEKAIVDYTGGFTRIQVLGDNSIDINTPEPDLTISSEEVDMKDATEDMREAMYNSCNDINNDPFQV